MAYDGIDELDMAQIKPLRATLPLFETIYNALEERDRRDPAWWRPTTCGQVLMRNGTNTVHSYSGRGVMLLAEEMMRRSAPEGSGVSKSRVFLRLWKRCGRNYWRRSRDILSRYFTRPIRREEEVWGGFVSLPTGESEYFQNIRRPPGLNSTS